MLKRNMGLGQQLRMAIYSKNNGKIQELLGRIDASTINEANLDGFTPLHAAGRRNNVEAVAKLLSFPGINDNARRIYGWTPIMDAAYSCSVEALQALLDHPTVDLDVRNNDGAGLEDLVGTDLTKKSKCVKMIYKARRKRETARLEQDQANHVNDFSESGNSLEEMRTNVRKVYVDKIDKVNQQIQENETMLIIIMELKITKMKNAIQDLMSNPEKVKLEGKKSKLEQELVKIQDEIKKHDEEMEKTLDILQDKFEKEEKEVRQQLSSFKEMANQLTKELRKQDMDPEDDASANLEAARETLECPVCMEIMRPPTKIWMCSSSHLVCEACKDQLEGRLCPTCRTEGVTLRAHMAEKFGRTLFNKPEEAT